MPVSQQPQSQVAQQHGLQLAGQAPPQQSALAAWVPGTNNDSSIKARKYIKHAPKNRMVKRIAQTGPARWMSGRAAGRD
jgi:hypothetical protein